MAFQHTYIPTINHGLDEEMHAVCFASLKKNERKIMIKKSFVLALHYISNRKIYIQNYNWPRTSFSFRFLNYLILFQVFPFDVTTCKKAEGAVLQYFIKKFYEELKEKYLRARFLKSTKHKKKWVVYYISTTRVKQPCGFYHFR